MFWFLLSQKSHRLLVLGLLSLYIFLMGAVQYVLRLAVAQVGKVEPLLDLHADSNESYGFTFLNLLCDFLFFRLGTAPRAPQPSYF